MKWASTLYFQNLFHTINKVPNQSQAVANILDTTLSPSNINTSGLNTSNINTTVIDPSKRQVAPNITSTDPSTQTDETITSDVATVDTLKQTSIFEKQFSFFVDTASLADATFIDNVINETMNSPISEDPLSKVSLLTVATFESASNDSDRAATSLNNAFRKIPAKRSFNEKFSEKIKKRRQNITSVFTNSSLTSPSLLQQHSKNRSLINVKISAFKSLRRRIKSLFFSNHRTTTLSTFTRSRAITLLPPLLPASANPLIASVKAFLDHILKLLQWINQSTRTDEGQRKIRALSSEWNKFSDLMNAENNSGNNP